MTNIKRGYKLISVMVGLSVGLLLAEGLLGIISTKPLLGMNRGLITGRTEWQEKLPERVEGALNLVLVGDSVVFGTGASPGMGVADVLAQELQKATGQEVNLTNLGRPGANYNHCLGAARVALRENVADALVVVLFSDDLNLGQVVAQRGSIVDFLDHQPGLLVGSLLERSYLFRRLWLFWLTQTTDLDSIDFFAPDRQQAFIKAMEELRRLSSARGVPTKLVLLPAAGLPLCKDNPRWNSACNVARKTLDSMAGALDQLGIPYLDLRHVWDDGPIRVFAKELRPMPGGHLGVPPHPNNEGHALIAKKILPALLEEMKKDQVGP